MFTNNVLELDKFWGTVLETTPSYSTEEVLANRLASAALDGKIKEVAELLKAKANPNWNGHPSNQTPLLLAAAWGHEKVCEMLLQAGAEKNVYHEIYKLSPLGYAELRAKLVPDNPESPDPIRRTVTDAQIEVYKRIALLLRGPEKR